MSEIQQENQLCPGWTSEIVFLSECQEFVLNKSSYEVTMWHKHVSTYISLKVLYFEVTKDNISIYVKVFIGLP